MRTYRPGSPRSLFVVAAVIGASALSIGACGRPAAIDAAEVPLTPAVTSSTAEFATPATTAGTAHSPPETTSTHGWPRCVNSAEGFSIKYPPTWYTTQTRPEEVCVQFHPSRFVIPLQGEYPLTALNAKRVTALPSRTDTAYERILLWRTTTVAGRQAVRFETSSTGEGLYQAGTREYGYVVRLGGGLISVHTTAEPGETRYAAWKAVVDDAVRTLAAPGPTPSHRGCAPIETGFAFYAAGRVGTDELTTPASGCSTINVSHSADPTNPADRCQTFRHRLRTGAAMSMIGFAVRPGTDVEPMCSTGPVSRCAEAASKLTRSSSNSQPIAGRTG